MKVRNREKWNCVLK